jgi:hypothetical protein
VKEENVIIILYYPGFYGERMARILQESNNVSFSGDPWVWEDIENNPDRFTDLVEFKKFAENSDLSLQDLFKYHSPRAKYRLKSMSIKPYWEKNNCDIQKTREDILIDLTKKKLNRTVIITHECESIIYEMFPHSKYIVMYGNTKEEISFGCNRYVTYACPFTNIFGLRHLYKGHSWEKDQTGKLKAWSSNTYHEIELSIELEKHMKWVTGADLWYYKEHNEILTPDTFEEGFNTYLKHITKKYYSEWGHPSVVKSGIRLRPEFKEKAALNTLYISLSEIENEKELCKRLQTHLNINF